MNVAKSRAHNTAASRARRRAAGLTAIEAVLHRDEIASLDQFKARLGVASRSEVLRLLIAKADASTLIPADAVLLSKSAG
jgi:hypothetical protein